MSGYTISPNIEVIISDMTMDYMVCNDSRMNIIKPRKNIIKPGVALYRRETKKDEVDETLREIDMKSVVIALMMENDTVKIIVDESERFHSRISKYTIDELIFVYKDYLFLNSDKYDNVVMMYGKPGKINGDIHTKDIAVYNMAHEILIRKEDIIESRFKTLFGENYGRVTDIKVHAPGPLYGTKNILEFKFDYSAPGYSKTSKYQIILNKDSKYPFMYRETENIF